MPPRLAVLAVAIATVAAPRAAAAECACIDAGFRMLSPSADEPAPRNTRVRVAYAHAWQTAVTIAVRAEDGRVVPAARQILAAGERRVAEVVPARLLEPDTRYEVVAFEDGIHPSETVVGAFVTGGVDDVDREAPRWNGARRGARVRVDTSCAGGSRAVIVADPARDPASEIAPLYAVWLPRGGGVDLDEPPSTYAHIGAGRITLGTGCRDPGLPRGPERVAVTAVDAAGNRSAVSWVMLR